MRSLEPLSYSIEFPQRIPLNSHNLAKGSVIYGVLYKYLSWEEGMERFTYILF
jgi:hypothetical protein